MGKHITIYSNVGHFFEVFEIQLDIAQRHLDQGDKVEFVFCSGFIPICEVNRDKEITTCMNCISRRNQGVKLLNKRVKKANLSYLFTKKDRDTISSLKTNFKNGDDLKEYYLEDFMIGISVYSSIADLERDYIPDVKKYRKEIKDYITTSAHIYLAFKRYIQKNKPDLVYVYNGRHALELPVIAACEVLGTEFVTHEWSYNGGYDLYYNTLPHDYEYRYQQIDKVWNDSQYLEKEKIRIGKQFYEHKIGKFTGNITISWKKDNIKIIKNKFEAIDKITHKNILPECWNPKNHNIVWFLSSEFEDYTAPQYCNDNNIYTSQLDAIYKIVNETGKVSNKYRFYIRLHPKFSMYQNKVQEQYQYEKIRNMNNVTLIYPDSIFCSYHLMDNADKVLAFRSTAAAESAYRNIPTMMLNKHILYRLDSFYSPTTHKEVMDFVINLNIKPLDNYDAIKFGFYNLMFGIKPKYYTRSISKSYEEGWGLFKGRKVTPSTFISETLIPLLNNRRLTKFKNFINKYHYLLINKFLGTS